MSRRPVVWALVHDIDRSGVPVALLRLLRWHQRDPVAEVHVVARHDGALRGAFAAASASLTTLEPARGRSPASTIAVAAAQAGVAAPGAAARDRWYRHRVRSLPRPDVVLVQGAGAWPSFASLQGSLGDPRVVVHLHELAHGLGRCVTPPEQQALVERADAVLVVAEPVGALAASIGVRPSTTTIVPGSVDDPPGGWDRAIEPAAEGAVVSIGQAGWRKGSIERWPSPTS